ncbi:MAG: adenylate/guanylate cyclase domain-containing protein [Cytophagales bacterium]
MKFPFYIVLSLFLASTALFAEKVFELNETKDDNGNGIMYLVDSSAAFNINSIQQYPTYTQFKTFTESDVPNLGQIYYGIWFQFKSACREPHCINKTYFFVVDNAQIDSLSFYSLENKKLISTQIQGLKVPFKNRIIAHQSLVFAVKHTKIGEQSHFMLMKGRDTKFLPISINSHHNFLVESAQFDTYVALYVGIFLAMIFYNLFLFFSTKEPAFLYYVLYMSTFMVVQLSVQGFTIRLMPVLSWHTFSINLILLSSASFFALRFSKSFLEINLLNKKLSQLSYLADFMVLTATIGGIFTFFTDALDPFLNLFIIFVILICVIFIIFFGVYAYRKGVRAARYFLIAWGLLLIGILLRSLVEVNLAPVNFVTLYASQIGSVLEMLLLSMGLADRINQAKVEVNKAQLKTIDLLIQNEQTLEKKVSLRTVELQMLNDELKVYLSQLEVEKKKSENLLLNILPEEVASELKLKGQATPKYFEQATVLFADLVNFTSFAEINSPQSMIENLNELFEKFDDICVRNGLEKIKTIGDCYMAAGGLPTANTTNAIDAVRSALEMMEIANANKWNLRIGIHTGAVIAGVVGKRKFAYDIWGDAVNIASRMESKSENNKINISSETHNLVKASFACTYRGKIMAKNKGEVDMYFVDGNIS